MVRNRSLGLLVVLVRQRRQAARGRRDRQRQRPAASRRRSSRGAVPAAQRANRDGHRHRPRFAPPGRRRRQLADRLGVATVAAGFFPVATDLLTVAADGAAPAPGRRPGTAAAAKHAFLRRLQWLDHVTPRSRRRWWWRRRSRRRSHGTISSQVLHTVDYPNTFVLAFRIIVTLVLDAHKLVAFHIRGATSNRVQKTVAPIDIHLGYPFLAIAYPYLGYIGIG